MCYLPGGIGSDKGLIAAVWALISQGVCEGMAAEESYMSDVSPSKLSSWACTTSMHACKICNRSSHRICRDHHTGPCDHLLQYQIWVDCIQEHGGTSCMQVSVASRRGTAWGKKARCGGRGRECISWHNFHINRQRRSSQRRKTCEHCTCRASTQYGRRSSSPAVAAYSGLSPCRWGGHCTDF